MGVAKGGKNFIKRKNTSIFFMLWTVFSLFSVAIVCLFGFGQRYILNRSYKERIAEDVSRCGKTVQKELATFGANPLVDYSGFLYSRAFTYDMSIFLVDDEGEILYPQGLEDYSGDLYAASDLDFSARVEKLKKELKKADASVALYEGEAEYVYGADLQMRYGGSPVYLYVSESLELSRSILSDMTVRIVLSSAFVLILAFVTAGAISGWLSKPITEMTQKAKRLAHGDFSVDFSGASYCSELSEFAETLNVAKDEISKADQMQKELIANVSHDFKTPLTMIKGYASMIKEISGGNPEKRNKHAQVIIDETDRLTSLVADVLDLSKLRAGIDTLKKQAFDLSDYTFDVLEKFGDFSKARGYTFRTDVEPHLVTRADPVKIGQVLYNLVGNAVNYTGEDKTVYVALKKEGNVIRFSVRDTGEGIEAQDLKDIWERYYRSGETHKRPVQGTGLGLSIVKTILEKHGFTFGVESKRGEGSTFYVLFPLF